MKLYRVILPVGDIDEAQAFYSEILGINGERVSNGRHYYNLEGTILACYDPIADGDSYGTWIPHYNQYLYISVKGVEKVLTRFQSLKKGKITSELAIMPWGEKLFYSSDPWSNPICFVEESTVFLGDYH